MERSIEKAKTLTEALPYIQRFRGKTLVIKYGGSAMKEDRLRQHFAQDIVLMSFVGLHPVVVHGGGPQIGQILERLGKPSRFVQGMRVTDAETMEVVEMVLCGKINKDLVRLIQQQGGKAVGLSGKDGSLIRARKLILEEAALDGVEDMGFVGEVTSIQASIIETLDNHQYIPVVAPVGVGEQGETYNINADLVASRLAVSLKADKLILLTDVEGILDPTGELISSIGLSELEGLLKRKVVSGGMIPKVLCCADAIRNGVRKAHIVDGRVEHSVLLEVFTDGGVGTEIYAD
ncbi:MAG: acetylglutamate kinase [bacterium]